MSLQLRVLTATDGFLKNARVDFHPGLTCIIGTRGTCKSTLVETIRFTFNCDEARVQELVAPATTDIGVGGPSRRGLIRSTLSAGIAKCELARTVDGSTQSLSIEREVGGKPRVYRDGIQELADLTALSCIEIYSQGDLQEIAENEGLRLELIDRPNKLDIEKLRTERQAVFESLRNLGIAIRATGMDIETRRADVRALPPLRTQLADLQTSRPALSPELDREREEASSRRNLLERMRGALHGRSVVRQALQEAIHASSPLPNPPSELSTLESQAASTILAECNRFSAFVASIRQELERNVDSTLDAAAGAIAKKCDELNARFNVLRQEQLDVNDSLKREEVLKQQIVHLEKLQAELDASNAKQGQLIQQRVQQRTRLREIADRIFSLRQHEVDLINSRHGDSIVLTLQQGGQSTHYEQRIADLLQGSRLRSQEEVARDLARNVLPSDLIDIVEASDVGRLTQLLQRDAGQMTRLIAHLADRNDLYQLEAEFFEDRLDITMFDGDVAKPVGQLSKGQMATALLPLILRPAPYPLIFDQPEDDLDNSFIFDTLVKQIHTLKATRQLIFVTHNANIPVLGEADCVVVMEMDNPRAAKAPMKGTVDTVKAQILLLLEGGAEAFSRRRQRYDSLLGEST